MIFLGKRPHREGASGPGKVYIIDEANISIRPLSHEPSVQVRSFGDGFARGYHGAGPSQLALALLLETTNDEELSCSICSSFKVDFIAEIQADCWVIDMRDIQDWINRQIGTEKRNIR